MLNKNEEGVLCSLKKIITKIWDDQGYESITREDLWSILSRIYIVNFDIEEQSTLEQALLTILTPKLAISPVLIWKQFISIAIENSKNRSSIDINFVRNIIKKHSNAESLLPCRDLNDSILNVVAEGNFSVAYDYVLTKSNTDKFDYLIFKIYRFNNDCGLRARFINHSLVFFGEKFSVIIRTSTEYRLRKYIEENADIYKDSTMGFIDTPQGEPNKVCEDSYLASIKQLASSFSGQPQCLHCGHPISENASYVV
ncbi:MAG: hypothetical protein ACK5JO_13630, partial [Halodesulfovibrio sp.]